MLSLVVWLEGKRRKTNKWRKLMFFDLTIGNTHRMVSREGGKTFKASRKKSNVPRNVSQKAMKVVGIFLVVDKFLSLHFLALFRFIRVFTFLWPVCLSFDVKSNQNWNWKMKPLSVNILYSKVNWNGENNFFQFHNSLYLRISRSSCSVKVSSCQSVCRHRCSKIAIFSVVHMAIWDFNDDYLWIVNTNWLFVNIKTKSGLEKNHFNSLALPRLSICE